MESSRTIQKISNTVLPCSYENLIQCVVVEAAFQVQTAADGGKHDDTSAIKPRIVKLIPYKYLVGVGGENGPRSVPSCVEKIQAPDLKKAWRGFNNVLTATLLCPVDYLNAMKETPDESVNVHSPRAFTDRPCSPGLR